jgi:hypothetical protein
MLNSFVKNSPLSQTILKLVQDFSQASMPVQVLPPDAIWNISHRSPMDMHAPMETIIGTEEEPGWER